MLSVLREANPTLALVVLWMALAGIALALLSIPVAIASDRREEEGKRSLPWDQILSVGLILLAASGGAIIGSRVDIAVGGSGLVGAVLGGPLVGAALLLAIFLLVFLGGA